MAKKTYSEFGDRILLESDIVDIPISVSRQPAQKQMIPVEVIYQRGPQMLRGPSMAAITGSISKVEVIWNGTVVDSVPSGEPFDVKVYFTANNPGGGNWTVAATVIGTDGSNAHYDVFNVTLSTTKTGSFLIQDAQSHSAPFIMPATALTLRVTLWGYPYSVGGDDFRSAVPQSQW